MRGLIYKDIRLLMSQKSFFGILFAVAAFISIIGDNASFSISYGTFMGMTAAISTLNFDEYDNGMAFLMTLPTGKRSYVSSKYIFCYGAALLSSVIVTMLCALGARLRGVDMTALLYIAAAMVPLSFIMLSTMLPIYIKFGGNRSRLVTGIMIGLYGALYMGLLPIIYQGGDLPTPSSSLSPYAVLLLLCIISVPVSLRISRRIMDRKEF